MDIPSASIIQLWFEPGFRCTIYLPPKNNINYTLEIYNKINYFTHDKLTFKIVSSTAFLLFIKMYVWCTVVGVHIRETFVFGGNILSGLKNDV